MRLCRNRIACRTLSRHPVPGFRLPCVFYIVSQLFDFVKNFFRTSVFACCRNCNPFPAFRLSVGILCPVRFAVLGLRVDYITNPSQCQALFSVFRKLFLTFTRGKGLFFASLLQSALCAPVSARSARVHLVTLTVGVMALFHLPGLSPVDFYRQSRVAVCGCVGA